MNNKLYKLMNWPKIEDIIYSECDNPHQLLGPHPNGNQTLVQAYFPGAKKVALVYRETREAFQMERADDDGFFAVLIPEANIPAYYYVVKEEDGTVVTREEPYRFAPLISASDLEKFKNGIHYTIYEKLGAHPIALDGVHGVYFALWAPSAMRVSVVGDFNKWDGRVHQMRRLGDSGIFELFVPGAKVGDHYKFELKLKNGLTYLKADPYANSAQAGPEHASVITNLYDFQWEDMDYVSKRAERNGLNQPTSIYEVYLGAIINYHNMPIKDYVKIAEKLVSYCKLQGFTHVEFMPVMEYPSDETYGYQTLGYYAPTARYGSPKGFMTLINELHKADIGVILDWVPAYFPADSHGLADFDGTALYEHKDPRQGIHPMLGTRIFNLGRREVSNFLIANAIFWVEKYHADGLRLCGVSDMLYLNYGRKEGEWIPNMYGGEENLDAIEFMKHLNSILKKRNPGVITIADDHSAYPAITGDLKKDGLGFDYKWNYGFMNDYMNYIHLNAGLRSEFHKDLLLSTVYAYSERFILAFSHDLLWGGKEPPYALMAGDRDTKFANFRLTFSYIMCHPGKKLIFMGQEMGYEFGFDKSYHIGKKTMLDPLSDGLIRMYRELNHLYKNEKCFFELDDSPDGFEWINHLSADKCYLVFARKALNQDEMCLVVANFSQESRKLTVGVPRAGKYKEIFNSDATDFGGTGFVNSRVKKTKEKECDTRPQSITVKAAPLSLSVFRYSEMAFSNGDSK